MKAIAPLLLLTATAASAADRPHTYILSIAGVPLRDNELFKAFSFETWGVQFKAVCRIPLGWRIKAGGSATPNGEFSGEGSQGATWFNRSSPRELHAFLLVTLSAPVQRSDIKAADGSSIVPATFKGFATLETDDGDKQVQLSYRNISLNPASECLRRQ